MNTKSKIYVLALIWGAALVQLVINSSIDREEKLVRQAMSEGVSELTESTVKGFGLYGTETMSDSARELIVTKAAAKLGVTSGYDITTEQANGKTVTRLLKRGEQGDTEVKLVTATGTDTYGQPVPENYLMVQVDLKEQASSAAMTIKKKVVALYESLGIEPSMNLHMQSQVKGRLTDGEMTEEIESFLKETDAKKVSEDTFDNIKTVYGYSKNIDEFVYQDTHMVNVQIAFSYDAENDVTYIHRALPFIDCTF